MSDNEHTLNGNDDLNMKYFFVDTNLFLQCRDLSNLPWSEISDDGSLELIIPRAVQEEIDRLKNDGNSRRAKRARNANSYLRKIIFAENERMVVRESQPKVEITFSINLPSPTSIDHFLDPKRADDSIILELLSYRQHFGDRCTALLTLDTNPMLTAKKLGIPFRAIPDSWLLEPEPDDRDKKLRAVEARLSALEKSVPEIIFSTIDGKSEFSLITASIIEYPPLSRYELQGLMSEIEESYPIEQSFGDEPYTDINRLREAMGGRMEYHPPSPSEIEKYQNKDYPNWLSGVEKQLEDFQRHLLKNGNRLNVSFSLANLGNTPAENLLVRIEVSSGLKILPPKSDTDQDIAPPEFLPPPIPPKGKYVDAFSAALLRVSRAIPSLASLNAINAANRTPLSDILRAGSNTRRDRNGFFWKPLRPSTPESIWELECEEFRHKVAAELFELDLTTILDQQPAGGTLTCIVAAKNLPDLVKLSVPIKLSYTRGNTIEAARKFLNCESSDLN